MWRTKFLGKWFSWLDKVKLKQKVKMFECSLFLFSFFLSHNQKPEEMTSSEDLKRFEPENRKNQIDYWTTKKFCSTSGLGFG